MLTPPALFFVATKIYVKLTGPYLLPEKQYCMYEPRHNNNLLLIRKVHKIKTKF